MLNKMRGCTSQADPIRTQGAKRNQRLHRERTRGQREPTATSDACCDRGCD
ncbi:unnamed protein product [Laminaria digitata]